MPRLSADQWEELRAEREAGSSFGPLAEKYGVSKTAIVRRAKKEGWGNGADLGDTIRRKVAEKVSGIVTAHNPQKVAAAIDSEAERGAEVLRRHREETNAVRERLYAGLKTHKSALGLPEKKAAFEDLKAAKIASETIINIHKAERQAWGLDADSGKDETIVIERKYGL